MNQAQIVTAAAALAVILGGGYWQDVFSGTQVFYLLVFAGAGYALFYMYENDVIGDIDSPFGEQVESSALERSVSFTQMRRDLRQWAEDGYRGEENISIPLDRADFDSKPLTDNDQVLFCVTGALGQSNKPVLIFYEATGGRVVGHKLIRTKDMEKNPFDYSDYYQEYKRRTRGGAGDLQPGAVNGGMSGMSMYNAMMAAQNGGMPARRNQRGRPDDSDSEDDGDNEE